MSEMRAMKNKKPYSWQDKDVLRLIHLRYDGSDKELTTAIALYLVLTFVASNKGSDNFEVTRGALRGYSGLAFPTIDKRLKEFEELEIIKIVRNRWSKKDKKKLPLVVTLYSLPEEKGM
ncbi:MAG: hypothetical protein H8E26_15600 [FCB group bacterium]|nr:hypothetical protein [FCB group bacterium]